MDLRRLEIFVKVAELGSFSRAAEALFLTQPTVSEHVRALEDELGLTLLDRLGRGAAPTRAGQLLLGYARRMLALGREARQAMDQFQGRMSGELMVGGSTIPGEYILPAFIGGFKGKYPDISISLVIAGTAAVLEMLEGGRVEVAMVGARPAQRTFEARAIMGDELVVVVAPDHPWSGRGSITLAELREEPLLVRERGSGTREAFERAAGGAGLGLTAFRVVGEMGSTQAMKQGVRAGIGIALISSRAVVDECRARHLVAVRVEDLVVERAFYLVTNRDRTRSPLAEAFVHFVESQAPGSSS
ncbi:MAG TPA: selenium metabolism-associated LysR family transcriptional regulator [Methylomirabilota bacterium]|jgi:DNA-binding transcriptional LysR family regulator